VKKIFEPKPDTAIVTLPNIVTITGIFMVFLYVWGYLSDQRWSLIIGLVLAGVSDLLDGELARRLGQKTRLGEIIDPARDRLLLAAVLGNILFLFPRHLFPIATIVLLEIHAAFINLISYRHGGHVHLFGKLRQAIHLLVFGFLTLSVYFPDIVKLLTGIDFHFPATLALSMMLIASLAAWCAYFLISISYLSEKNK
jgi:cardiolipin synthase (CMP-forming)